MLYVLIPLYPLFTPEVTPYEVFPPLFVMLEPGRVSAIYRSEAKAVGPGAGIGIIVLSKALRKGYRPPLLHEISRRAETSGSILQVNKTLSRAFCLREPERHLIYHPELACTADAPFGIPVKSLSAAGRHRHWAVPSRKTGFHEGGGTERSVAISSFRRLWVRGFPQVLQVPPEKIRLGLHHKTLVSRP